MPSAPREAIPFARRRRASHPMTATQCKMPSSASRLDGRLSQRIAQFKLGGVIPPGNKGIGT
jgi:hypothetical protein